MRRMFDFGEAEILVPVIPTCMGRDAGPGDKGCDGNLVPSYAHFTEKLSAAMKFRAVLRYEN
ncbi:MAG: hypothetical protein H6883_08030 [Rhodobiaceae bacterium]|nr:hypothetical protein [Rhodobiaceae bacterium]MCC0056070.1 hypothetical protein [Rhodobiaceae bacterium]